MEEVQEILEEIIRAAQGGNTADMRAAFGRLDAAVPADLRQQVLDSNRSALMLAMNLAVWNEHVEAMQLLVDCAPYVITDTTRGHGPLYSAAFYGAEVSVEWLLDHNAPVGGTPLDQPLVGACQGGHLDVVGQLLRAKAGPDRAISNRHGPLDVALKRGDFRIARRLLDSGASVNATGNTLPPIAHAVSCRTPGAVGIVRSLLELKADVDTRPSPVLAALVRAPKDPVQVSMLIELLRAKMDPNVRAGYTTLLSRVLPEGNEYLVYTLLSHKASVGRAGNDWYPLATLAGSAKSYPTDVGVNIARLMLGAKADPGTGDMLPQPGPLRMALEQGPKADAIVSLLLEAKANVNSRDEMMASPLCAVKNLRTLKMLLEAGSVPTPLVLRRFLGPRQQGYIKLLVEAKADINGRITDARFGCLNFFGQHDADDAVLSWAVFNGGDCGVVKNLLELKANPLLGSTPILHACAAGIHGKPTRAAIAELLLRAKADVNATGQSHDTALHLACSQRRAPLARVLLQQKADPRVHGQRGFTPLQVAALYGAGGCVELLLACGVPVDAKCVLKSSTALHLAATHKPHPFDFATHTEPTVAQLLRAKARVNAANSKADGLQTPLHLAVTHKNVPAVKLLLEAKARVDAVDVGLQTPLDRIIQGSPSSGVLHGILTAAAAAAAAAAGPSRKRKCPAD